MGYNDDGGWAPYVTVAQRRAAAAKAVKALQKKGRVCLPVVIDKRTIATSFWGKKWCDNLEAYSDYENRLPRGRTYVRNGSVVDLQIGSESITALVAGSRVYEVSVTVRPLEPALWKTIRERCAGQVASLVELLQGRLSAGVMEVVAQAGSGLFPAPRQIKFRCSCPDGAGMCKHIAAALYGVGNRLDQQPELLFKLRNIDPAELIQSALSASLVQVQTDPGHNLGDADLSALFGIDLDVTAAARPVETISAYALTSRGVPAHMRQCWLKSGVLLASGQRAVYVLADGAEKAIEAYLARRAR
jgi:uncharacterized Zn finger protein